MSELARCDACGRQEPGSRIEPPPGWGAYDLQALGTDEPDPYAVTLLVCSVECLAERAQVIVEMTRDLFEATGGHDDGG
jgi:hypothetical protein